MRGTQYIFTFTPEDFEKVEEITFNGVIDHKISGGEYTKREIELGPHSFDYDDDTCVHCGQDKRAAIHNPCAIIDTEHPPNFPSWRR